MKADRKNACQDNFHKLMISIVSTYTNTINKAHDDALAVVVSMCIEKVILFKDGHKIAIGIWQ